MMNPKMLTAVGVRRMIPPRPLDSHKGRNGHVLIVAGSRGMGGAAVLAALGALRAGAGLVTAAIPESERSTVAHQLPEALTLPLPETAEGALSEHAVEVLLDYYEKRSIHALAMGPGLTVHPSVAQVLRSILKEWEIPLVLDADGLNNITLEDVKGYPQVMITPHPLELGRLLNVERDVVKRDRIRVAENAARDYQTTVVLKGRHTVLTDGKETWLNPTGNSAMATGGMGDVLTGMLGGFLAQGLPLFSAACAGVYLHGLAADLVRVSDRGLLARDVAHAVPLALKKIGIR